MTGYSAVGQLLLADLKKAGVKIINSTEAFPDIGENDDIDEVDIKSHNYFASFLEFTCLLIGLCS